MRRSVTGAASWKMYPLPRTIKLIVAPVLLALMAGLSFLAWSGRETDEAGVPDQSSEIGLMTGLPLYWADGADISALLDGKAELPWVRQVLERRYRLRPLDYLGTGDGDEVSSLEGLERLLIVQPRGLSPSDNVALDAWVRDGGSLFYVLDPMLTREYAVPIGDPRHPPVIGLIPPVLPRWGVTMEVRVDQPDGPHLVSTPVGPVPVMHGGQLVPSDSGVADCTISPGALLARCTVGEGEVTILADATLFELVEGNEEQRGLILGLSEYAFR